MNRAILLFLFSTSFVFADVILDVEVAKKVPFRDVSPMATPETEDYGLHPTFDAAVSKNDNRLDDEPALTRLSIPLTTLPAVIPAEAMLSEYAKTWAKKRSNHAGPNCFHTSIASIFKNWKNHRYMNPSEFKCHLTNSFEEIEEPSQWGDLIGFFGADDYPIHGFTYLGKTRKNGEGIVFTKNGYGVSEYLFMTYKSVHAIYESFGIERIAYYRPVREAVDPSTDAKSPCAKIWSNSSKLPSALEIKDAVRESMERKARAK